MYNALKKKFNNFLTLHAALYWKNEGISTIKYFLGFDSSFIKIIFEGFGYGFDLK